MILIPSLQAGWQFGKYAFSHDSKYLLCCCGHVVKVFNTVNGECLHDLRGHTKTVTDVAVNPSNVLQVISSGQDGMLIYWDYLDGVKLRQHNLHMPLSGILHLNAEKKSVIMLAQTAEHKKTHTLMLWKKKKSDTSDFAKPKVLIENCDGDSGLVSFGCMKEYIASGLKHELAIYSMKKESVRFVSDNDKFNKHKAITCVACHPTEYCIATGLENGKIILWYSFFKDNQPPTSTMHWHALPVLCLVFTPDGSNLLSGGHECVLVRWQMGNQNQRDFKPRMGAPIKDILVSPNGNIYATRHADNVVQLLDINLKITQVYRGLTRGGFGACDNENPVPSGLKFDPRSRTLVTNGLPGHLQFYSIKLAKQLYNLDIVGQNYISPENLEQPKILTEVISTAISDDGNWLATFEHWDDGFFSPELRLKFWSYSSEAQTYSLNTTVEHPHEKKITSMLFRPKPSSNPTASSPVLVTVGSDLCFKSWTLVDDSDIYRSNIRWNCDSVGFYRGLNAKCADFSVDASTLAVAFEHLLTVWDPDTNVVRTTLSSSLPQKENIINVKFGNNTCNHHLVAATTNTLISWDLLTLTIQWNIKIQVSLLVRDPSTDIMAFVSSKRSVSFFRPSSADILYQHENVSSSDILDAVFVPEGRHSGIVDICWPGSSQIYFYTKEQQLITLDRPGQHDDASGKMKIAQHLSQNSLSVFMAEKLVREHTSGESKTAQAKTNSMSEPAASLFLQSNEPVGVHCDMYLNSLLAKKSKHHSDQESVAMAEKEDDSSEESSESETEMDVLEDASMRPSRGTDGQNQVKTTDSGKDMNKLLSKPLDWLNWCSSLHLK